MTAAITFVSQKDATDYRAADATQKGYPKVSKLIGSGRGSATVAELTTTFHADVVKHPTLSTWAYLDTSDFDSAVQKVPVPLGAAKADIDLAVAWKDAVKVP
jgi:hypothetical protein